ncbi:RNA polymerase sigma factor [Filimonas effusa]|uniref:Sigma-70 family RNA polymerase sigma factor n=1 Tax=Filimonas effusa TaxID=2508721 RepID=A0A4V1M9W8_9BACT|nr:sigma-70 family RNA polymerase sigma factor [Filimonas effusa]RXK83124.1 sigma-70 family RNA polymerase sigma factor [Filimonas effusa]
MSIHEQSRGEIWERGEAERSFTDIYNQLSQQIFLNVLKMVKDPDAAEEIVQEVFAHLWSKWDDIQIDKSLAGYIYRMSANKVYDFFRSIKSNKAMEARFTALAIEHYSHIEEALHYRESEQLLQKAMDTLTPQQQKVYLLCKTQGHSYKEAAEMMGISPNTVKEYLVKANQLVRNYLISNADKSMALLFWMIMKK